MTDKIQVENVNPLTDKDALCGRIAQENVVLRMQVENLTAALQKLNETIETRQEVDTQ